MEGFLYNICDDIEDGNTEKDTYELDRLVSREYEYYEKIEESVNNYIDVFLAYLKEFGFEIVGNNCFRITPDGKKNYFRKNYERFVELAKGMTLEIFSDTVYELMRNLEEPYGDAVYYHYFRTLDNFVRESEVGKVYYITEVYRMH